MFDIIKRILVTIISGAVIVYTGSLLSSQAVIVQPEHLWLNIISYIWLIITAGYMMVVYGIYPLYHPMQKRTLSLLGLILIVFGNYILLNDYTIGVYVWDMIKIFGVLIFRFGATGVLSSNKKIVAQKKHKNMEIIDA